MNNSSIKTVFASGVCILALVVSAFSAIRCCCDDMAETYNEASCHTVSSDNDHVESGHGQAHETEESLSSLAPELHSKCECVRAKTAQASAASGDPTKKTDSVAEAAKSGFGAETAQVFFYYASPDFYRNSTRQNKLVSTPSSPRAPPAL